MQAMPSLALSNLARAALWGWAKGAAFDLQTSGVTLNIVCPGRHRTDRYSGSTPRPNKDVGDPNQFGKLVAFLCSDHAAFISGTAIAVNGGSTLAL
jgi:3-oxoacyl-[acyl-carrier protein] reductase